MKQHLTKKSLRKDIDTVDRADGMVEYRRVEEEERKMKSQKGMSAQELQDQREKVDLVISFELLAINSKIRPTRT